MQNKKKDTHMTLLNPAFSGQNKGKGLAFLQVLMELMAGFEPATSSLPKTLIIENITACQRLFLVWFTNISSFQVNLRRGSTDDDVQTLKVRGFRNSKMLIKPLF